MMELYIQAFITVLSLMNPVMCGMLFQASEPGRTAPKRMKDAGKAALAVLTILVLAALLGERLLNAFGISLDVFSVAGGGVLVWMGFSMLRGVTAPEGASSSLTSLVLFAASPGTITGVISIAVVHTRGMLPLTALVAIAAATLITWLVMVVLAKRKSKPGGASFIQATVQSFMGLIVMAMGVQFGLKGLSAYFHLAGS
jgi:multiple antibiotic resistance protein